MLKCSPHGHHRTAAWKTVIEVKETRDFVLSHPLPNGLHLSRLGLRVTLCHCEMRVDETGGDPWELALM